MNLVDYNARVCFTENEWRSPFSACVWSCGGGVSGWRDLIHHLIPSSSPGKLQPLMQEVINMTH